MGGCVGGGGVGVHERAGQFRHGVGKAVFGLVRDPVGIGEAGGGVDIEFGVGVQAMSDPAHPHAAHSCHARFGGQRCFGGVDEFGVHPVHEPAEHITHCGAQHRQDGDRDDRALPTLHDRYGLSTQRIVTSVLERL